MDLPHRITLSHFATQTPKLKKKSHFNSPEHYTSHSPSPIKPRNSNGLEKFYISQHKKNALHELELINNRITQLKKQELNAKRKIELAQKFSEQIVKAKERHYLENQAKELWKELKEMEEHQQRKRNQEEKLKRTEKIKKYQLEILREKKTSAQLVKNKSRELDKQGQELKKMMERQKYEMKYSRYTEALEFKQRQESVKEDFLVCLKDEYEKKIAEEKYEHLQLINRKKELEKMESELVSRFANTVKLEENALKDLESVAKVSMFQLGFRI